MSKIVVFCLCIISAGCVSFAPPSPLVTYGGPKTTEKGTSEVAIAMGTGFALFENAHSGGQGWFGRYKYGIDDKFDIGIDAVGIVRSDKGTLTAKLAGRYQVEDDLRLEGGIGVADDSDGKSLNSDLGLTWGTINENRLWNYYSTIRVGVAKGYPGDIFGSGTIAPPNVLIGLVNLGTQGKIIDNHKFIFEGGFGYIFPDNHKPGTLIYLSCGLLFNIGKKL